VIYVAPVSEENQGALRMGTWGQDRLTEKSGLDSWCLILSFHWSLT